MKWFEKNVTDYQRTDAKQIIARFGLAGYAMYEILQQIAADNMEGDDVSEWGFVAKELTMEALSEKVGCSVDEFRQFLAFTDERFITERKNGRLFVPILLERMNEYAKRQYRKLLKKRDQSDTPDTTKNPECTDSTDKTERSDNPETPDSPNISAIQHNTPHHNTSQKNINTGETPPRPDSGRFSGLEPISNGKKPEVKPVKNRFARSAELPDQAHQTPPEYRPERSGGPSPIGDVLSSRTIQSAAVTGITKPWQDKGFEYAKKLGITLTTEMKPRWLKVFRQAAEGRKPGNLEQAYRYLADYPGNLTDEEKVNFFFSIYENGLNTGGKGV